MDNVKHIEDDVLIFTDDKEIIQIAQKVTKALNLNLIQADDTIDLYAIGAFFQIIDPEKVDLDYFVNFKEIHELENPKEFAVLLTKNLKEQGVKKFNLKYHSIIDDIPDFYEMGLSINDFKQNILTG